MTVLAFIPARAGSKGLPGKNGRPFAGKPLVQWTVDQAVASKRVDITIVSSDDEGILALSLGSAHKSTRAPELATDGARIEDAILDFLKGPLWSGVETVVLLQPTSPLRTPEDIDRAVLHLDETQADSLLSVVDGHSPFYWMRDRTLNWIKPYADRPRRQDMPECWQENGSIYAFRAEGFREHGDRLFGKTVVLGMEEWQRYEIDTLWDFTLCEMIFKEKELWRSR